MAIFFKWRGGWLDAGVEAGWTLAWRRAGLIDESILKHIHLKGGNYVFLFFCAEAGWTLVWWLAGSIDESILKHIHL